MARKIWFGSAQATSLRDLRDCTNARVSARERAASLRYKLVRSSDEARTARKEIPETDKLESDRALRSVLKVTSTSPGTNSGLLCEPVLCVPVPAI